MKIRVLFRLRKKLFFSVMVSGLPMSECPEISVYYTTGKNEKGFGHLPPKLPIEIFRALRSD
jgi:hypothetical protein